MKTGQKEVKRAGAKERFYEELGKLSPENPFFNIFSNYCAIKTSPQTFVRKINERGIKTDGTSQYVLGAMSENQTYLELLEVLKWIKGDKVENTGQAREFIMSLVLNAALASRRLTVLPVNGALDVGKPITRYEGEFITDVGVPSTDVVIGYYRDTSANGVHDSGPFVPLCSCNIEAGGSTSGAEKLPIHPDLQCPHVYYATESLLPEIAVEGNCSLGILRQSETEGELLEGINRFALENSTRIASRLEELVKKSRNDALSFSYDEETVKLATSRTDKLINRLRHPIEP